MKVAITQSVERNKAPILEVLKQYIAGEIRIQVAGGLLSILKNGYLGIVKEAGLPFAKFLAEHGVSNLSKIPEIIKKLKNQP